MDFKWLLEDHAAPDHTTISRFRTGRCMGVVEDLFYQYIIKIWIQWLHGKYMLMKPAGTSGFIVL